jgi:hypothetical protein
LCFFSWKNNIQLEDGVQLGDVLEFQSELALKMILLSFDIA